MDIALTFVILTTLVFGFVELVKPIYDPEKRKNLGDQIAAAGFGVLLCLLYSIDFFAFIGWATPIPYVGFVLTGLLAGSGGGKILHDLLGLLPKRAA